MLIEIWSFLSTNFVDSASRTDEGFTRFVLPWAWILRVDLQKLIFSYGFGGRVAWGFIHDNELVTSIPDRTWSTLILVKWFTVRPAEGIS